MKLIIRRIRYKGVYSLFLCFLLMNCKNDRSSDLIAFDVNGHYPVKTLDIKDIASLEYFKLEINDDFVFYDFLSICDSFIICQAANEFLFFSRTTRKPISKVSRYGNGPEEYNLASVAVYSEAEDDLFILDYPVGIKVYGKDGTFKRKLPFRDRSYPGSTSALYDYNSDYLLLYDIFQGHVNDYPSAFILISKQDGHIKDILIPYEEKIHLEKRTGMLISMPSTFFAVRNGKDFLLTDYSSDTVYRFNPDFKLIPALVRTPSIQRMDPKILLHSWLETDNYLFFSTVKVEYEQGFQTKGYLMEKHSRKVYQSNIQMSDYKGKELIIDPSVIDRTSNPQIGIIVFSSSELLTANEENKLSGALKEATECLDEDDEYLFMILKFR